MKYNRLMDRYQSLVQQSVKDRSSKYLMELDCIEHCYECGGLERYEYALKFAQEHKVKKVFDIGCAYGHQSEVFVGSDVDYVGVNDNILDYWNSDKFNYVTREYPFPIKVNKATDLAISVMCLTWNVYLYEGEKTLRKQLETLSRDFNHCLLIVQPNKLSTAVKYFKCCEIFDEFIYLSN